jgi:hypothetical protein
VEATFEVVYASTRLPLFHVKAGRKVIAPQARDEDRASVILAFELLSRIVLTISETWYGARRRGGFVFAGWVYDNLRSMLESARVLAMNDTDPFDRTQEVLARRSISY